jgi:hypothetical protein
MMERTDDAKRFAASIATLVILAGLFFAARRAEARDRIFSGDIMDSECAEMGSHDMKLDGSNTTAKDCTLACVKLGSKFVLYSAGTKVVFQLDDQQRPRQFAGDKVNVMGSLDRTTNTIHVTDIEPAS